MEIDEEELGQEEEKWYPAQFYSVKTNEMIRFENYSVSDRGNVKNNITRRVLKQRRDTKGYLTCNIYSSVIKPKKQSIHQMVVSSILGSPGDNQMTVDHINRNKLDNRIQNLRWATRQEQRLNTKRINAHPKRIPVSKFSLENIEIARYDSICKIEGFNPGGIVRSMISNEPYLGYIWKCTPIELTYNETWRKWDEVTDLSNLGRVRRLHSSGVFYQVFPNKHGNQGYTITKGKRQISLHRAMAIVFLGLEFNNTEMVAYHLNGDKEDNRLRNIDIIEKKLLYVL